VFTVDGNVVGATTILEQAAAPQSYAGSMQFDMVRRPSSDQVRRLKRDVDTSRAETLRAAADQATLTAAGRALLEQHHVSVDDKQRFASSCNVTAEENELVYGCNDHGHIHVLRVDRADVGSLMSVSLAHEMLHAVYASLSRSDRKRVDAMVQAAYEQYGDQHLRDVIAEYEKVEPGSTADELHSLLPTEIGTLPPALERYYAKWFTDRQQIVANYKVLDDKLSALEDQASQIDTQLTGLDAQLKSLDGQIEDAGRRADSLAAQIDSLRAQGRIDESNDLVDPQNAAANEANALVDQYNAMVDQYNALVDHYNQLTANYRELYDSISAVPFAEPQT
jgi:flagellar capping protein FliD